MTMRLVACAMCQRYDNDRDDGHYCEAFPLGIPPIITSGRVTHRLPCPGDHDKQWLPTAGNEDVFDHINVNSEPLGMSPLEKLIQEAQDAYDLAR